MFRKNYISLLLFIALFAVGSISASAQKTIGGKVELKDSKGKKTSFAGAKIDCYRIDVTESCGSATSDEEGKFSLGELDKDAKVIFGISGSGIAPQVVPNVRMDDSNTLVVEEGNGSTPSESAVREVAISYAKEKGSLTDAQKANLASLEKKAAERAAKNEKAKENNQLRTQYIKEGNEAFNKKDYNLAIEKYNLGYELDPEYIGGAPVFLNNKAVALKNRAADTYNTAVNTKDRVIINKAKGEVVTDFTNALNATTKAYIMTKDPKSLDGVSREKLKEDSEQARKTIKDVFSLMSKMNISLASSLSTEEDAKTVIAIYQTSLGILPDDPDIIAGLALALYTSGEFTGNMDQKKESLSYWNKFKKIAPKAHQQHPVADELIEVLKEEVN